MTKFALAVVPKNTRGLGAWLGMGNEEVIIGRAVALETSFKDAGVFNEVEVVYGPVKTVRATLEQRASSVEPGLYAVLATG